MTSEGSPGLGRRGLLTAALAVPLGTASAACAAKAEPQTLIDPRLFGAKCDGIADDSAAVQEAIDTCLSSDPPPMLVVTGPLRITRTLAIKRPVDKSKGRFRIVGTGGAAGFVTDRPIALFGAGGRVGRLPASEFVAFEDVRFEASDADLGARVMTGEFLRVEFAGCDFHAIRCVDSPIFAQEWRFYRCVARYWKGSFFRSRGGYNVVSHGGKYQHGSGRVFEIADPSGGSGCVGCSFHQDIVEASLGPFLEASLVQGLSIAGLYSEGNAGPTLRFGSNGPNRGVNVSGCFFAPQDANKRRGDFFDIEWGRTVAGAASGNAALGGLHDNAQVGPGFASSGDHTEGRLFRAAR